MNAYELSRRGFIGSTIGAAVGVATIPAPLSAFEVLSLHGDGVHDDTRALEALFAGRPVITLREDVVACFDNGTVRLINGRFLTSRPLRIDPKINTYFGSCSFRNGSGPALPYPSLHHTA